MRSTNKKMKMITLLFIIFVIFVGCASGKQESANSENSFKTVNSMDSPDIKNEEGSEEPLDSKDTSQPSNSKDKDVQNSTKVNSNVSDKETGKSLIVGQWTYVKQSNDEDDYIMMITDERILIGVPNSEWFFKSEYEIVDYDEPNKTVQLLDYEIEEDYGPEEEPQLLEPDGIDVYKIVDDILYITDFNGHESQWKKD